MEPVQVTSVWGQWLDFETNREENKEAQKLTSFRSRLFVSLFIVFLLSYLAMAVFLAAALAWWWGALAFLPLLAVMVEATRSTKRSRRAFAKVPSEFRADDAGVACRSRIYEAHYSWDAVIDVLEGNRIVCLVIAPSGWWAVAKRHFPSQAAIDDLVTRGRNLANRSGPLDVVKETTSRSAPLPEA